MKKSLAILICLLRLMALPLFAESFRSYTPGDGLSHSTVLLSVQDGSGRMWFGTEDGLNSFDGYNFKVYRNDVSDPATVPGDRISSMEVCSNGELWVSSGTMISRYDAGTDSFTSWEHPSLRRQVRNIFEICPGKIGVTYEGQTWCFDVGSEKFETESVPAELINSTIICCCSSLKAIALGSAGGDIYLWDKSNGEIKTLRKLPKDMRIKSLLLEDEELWVGTEGSGLLEVELASGTVTHFMAGSGGLSSDYVRAICRDSQGRLWIGSYQGLDIFADGNFTHFAHKTGDRTSIGDNSIRTITRDSQGGMWLGSFYGGLNYWHKSNDHFSPIEVANFSFPEDGSMQAMAEAPDGGILMGVDYQTVVRYDPVSRLVRKYTVCGKGGAPLNIKAMHFDGDKVYLCSRMAGLIVLDTESGSYYSTEGSGLAENISCILPRDCNRIYLGTPNGVILYDKSDGSSKLMPSTLTNASVSCMIRDEKGRIWVGGNGGIALYCDEGNDFAPVGIDDNLVKIRKVRKIFQTSSGEIYICAERLFRYSPASGKTDVFSISDGLPTNLVSEILEDDFGRLWIFTANGLCCFNPSTRNFKQYHSNEGIPYTDFGSASICRTGSGTVYVGTRDGVMTFCPQDMENNPFCPAPFIANVYHFGKKLTGDIVLPYDQNTLSFELGTYNYVSGGSDEFAFKLDGYDKEWRNQKGDNRVTYYNIPPGKYCFELRAANNDGVWNTETVQCKVVVRHFFASAPLAIAIYILLAVGIIASLVYIRFQRQERKHLEEVHALKVRFFINFLNELKTPLTLINSPLQEMIPRSETGWMRSQLKYVEKNSGRLIHLVNQMMLFRKAQLDVINLKVCRYDADKLIRETVGSFAKYLHRKGVVCEYHSDIEGKMILVDPQYLELIMSNLLSNATKFTKEGSVKVFASLDGNFLKVEVKDTGIGIPKDKIEQIFERYFNSGSEYIGSGLGLSIVKQLLDKHHGKLSVDSVCGEGSAFSFFIPQDSEEYGTGEIVAESDYEFSGKDDNIELEDYGEISEEEMFNRSAGIKGRILFVISDAKMRDYLNKGLSRNFDVLICDSETEAMSLCLSHEIDAVIAHTDERIDGLRLCHKIKSDSRIKHVPVIILSPEDSTSLQLGAFVAGASDFIAKPFSLAVLTVKIGNMISSQRKESRAPDEGENDVPVQIYGDKDERFLDKVSMVVESRMDDPSLSIDDVAKEVGMSRSGFFIRIKALTGLAPQDYIKNVRLTRACKFLLEGGKSIAEIAELTGFSTASYFSRAFKNYYGVLPSKYKSENEKD